MELQIGENIYELMKVASRQFMVAQKESFPNFNPISCIEGKNGTENQYVYYSLLVDGEPYGFRLKGDTEWDAEKSRVLKEQYYRTLANFQPKGKVISENKIKRIVRWHTKEFSLLELTLWQIGMFCAGVGLYWLSNFLKK